MTDPFVGYACGLVVAGGFLVCGGVLLRRTWGRYAVVRLMAQTRTSQVSELGSTRRPFVEVTGLVAKKTDRLLESPVSRRPCVYYELVVEELDRSGKRPRWRRRLREMKRVGFGIFDGTGTVDVDVSRGELLFEVDEEGRHGFKKQSSPELVRAMALRKQVVRSAYGPDELRYRETVLEDGDRIYALGAYDGKRLRKSVGGVLILADGSERVAGQRVAALAREDLVAGAITAFVGAFFLGMIVVSFFVNR